MKNFLFIAFLFFYCLCGLAQPNAKYQVYTKLVEKFSRPNRLLGTLINDEGNGTVEYTNPQNQILRFHVFHYKLQPSHGGIAFELFTYKNTYLKTIESFDMSGKLAGERESQNEAVMQFIIEKPIEYLKKKKIIDDSEGNSNLKDDSNEKIIRRDLFDPNGVPIKNTNNQYISTKTYWEYNHRMYGF